MLRREVLSWFEENCDALLNALLVWRRPRYDLGVRGSNPLRCARLFKVLDGSLNVPESSGVTLGVTACLFGGRMSVVDFRPRFRLPAPLSVKSSAGTSD